MHKIANKRLKMANRPPVKCDMDTATGKAIKVTGRTGMAYIKVFKF